VFVVEQEETEYRSQHVEEGVVSGRGYRCLEGYQNVRSPYPVPTGSEYEEGDDDLDYEYE